MEEQDKEINALGSMSYLRTLSEILKKPNSPGKNLACSRKRVVTNKSCKIDQKILKSVQAYKNFSQISLSEFTESVNEINSVSDQTDKSLK